MIVFCSKSVPLQCRDHLHYEHDSGVTWLLKRDSREMCMFVKNLEESHSLSRGPL